MKKRVRVYRPGGQTNQPTHKDIVNYVSQEMSADDFDGDTDAIKDDLVNAGISEDAANEYISNVSDDLGLNETEESIEEKERLAAEQEQAAIDEEQALLAQQEAAEEARKARLAAMYDTNIDMSTTEDTAEDEEVLFAKLGGSKPNKRSFIKQYTKFAKMAQGGDTSTPGADDVLNGREAHVNNFLGAVKNTANDAILRQQAEAQYNAIYGTPQIGAYQDGGIHQEEIDPENPLHHLSTYGADTRHIFSDDMYTQNDVAAMEQFGGNTGQGLYKFIGGGDTESADEMYQDADLDYNQYAEGGFLMPKRSGRQYVQAINSPYYSATGERIAAPNLAGRQVSSVDITKRGLFGQPKALRVNYGSLNTNVSKPLQQIKMPTEEQAKALDAQYAAKGKDNYVLSKKLADQMSDKQAVNNRQPVADWMMRSGIPGVKQLGARMTKSGMIPEVPVGAQPTSSTAAPTSDIPYYPPMSARAQRREARDDARLNRLLGNNNDVEAMNDAKEIERIQKKLPGYKPFNSKYAYGGDISIPDIYRAQIGTEVAFNPNDNNMNISNLQGFFDKAPTKDVIGDEITPTVTENMQPDDISQDYLVKKNRNKTRDNFNMGMMAVNAGLDIADQVRARKQENQLNDDLFSVESNYGINDIAFSGYHDPNTGRIDPSQTGQKISSKYGGGIYATGGSFEDEDEGIVYMTEAQIKRFLEEGGELEYV